MLQSVLGRLVNLQYNIHPVISVIHLSYILISILMPHTDM